MLFRSIYSARNIGVVGLGGIGMSALLGSICESNAKIYAFDINADRLHQAKSIGANYICNVANTSPRDFIDDLSSGSMLDIVFECSGNISALNNSLSLINNSGIIKFASHPKSGELLTIDPFQLILGKRLEGSWGGGINPDRDLNYMARNADKNKSFVEYYRSSEYTLDQVNQAIDDLRAGLVLRPILNMYH